MLASDTASSTAGRAVLSAAKERLETAIPGGEALTSTTRLFPRVPPPLILIVELMILKRGSSDLPAFRSFEVSVNERDGVSGLTPAAAGVCSFRLGAATAQGCGAGGAGGHRRRRDRGEAG